MEDSKYDALKDSAQYNSTTKVEEAKRFLANVVWTYEEVRERGTTPKNGKHNRITMRRFAPGAPGGCVREVLDLLTQQAPYADPVISNMVFPGKWKPKYSWFRKDSRDETVNYKTHTVTLIQDLVPADEGGDTEIVSGGGNCLRKDEYEYVWDADEVSPPPEGTQGVQYSVQHVNRDDDSGLFSYVIHKSIAVSRHTPPYVSDQTATTIQTTETWENAYDEDLVGIDLPDGESTDVASGETVKVEKRQNEDCTWNLVITRTRSVDGETAETCKKTLTQHDHVVVTGGQEKMLDEAPPAEDGVYYEHSSRKEDDGTFTNTVTETTEQEVNDHTVKRSGTVYGVSVTRLDVNTDENPADEPVGVGESIEVTRTPGGLYNVQRTCFILNAPDCIVETKAAEITKTTCSTRTVVESKGEEIATALGGTRTSYNYRLNEYGKWDRDETIETEINVNCYTFKRSGTLYGVQTVISNVNTADAPYNDTVGVGESIEISRTPGGLFNVQRTCFVLEDLGCVVETRARELSKSTCTTRSVVESKGEEIATAEGGVRKSYNYRLNEYGTWDRDETVETEIEVPDHTVRYSGTLYGTRVERANIHVASAPPNASAVGIGESVEVSRTPGGLYNVQRTCFILNAPGSLEEVRSAKFTETSCSTKTVSDSKGNETASASGGVLTSYKYHLNEYGKWEKDVTVTTEIAREGFSIKRSGTLFGVRTETTDVNVSSAPGSEEEVGIGESIEVTRTPGGLYNVQRTCFNLTNPSDLEESSGATISQESRSVKTVCDVKQDVTASAGGGILTSYHQKLNDYGKWEICETTVTEKGVSEQTVVTEVTLKGTRRTVKHINQASTDGAEAKKIGDSVQIDKTDGGLYNITKTSLCMSDEMDTSWSASSTAFEKTYSKTSIQDTKLSCIPDSVDGLDSVTTASEGLIKTARSCLTDTGAYENQEVYQQEVGVTCAVVQVETTAFGKNIVVVHQNQCESQSTDQAGVTIRNDLTDGGLYDVTVTCVCRNATKWTYTNSHTHFLDQTRTDAQGVADKPADLAGDTYGSMSVTLCEDGRYDYTKIVATPTARSWESRSEAYGNGMTVTVNEHKNAEGVNTVPTASLRKIYRNSKELNEYGKYDIEYVTQTAGTFWDCTIKLEQDDGATYFYFYENAEAPLVPEYSGTVESASTSISRDQFGLFSGSVTVAFRPKKGSSSSGGTSDDDEDKEEATKPGGTCNTLGRTTIAAWKIDGQAVETTTTEFYNGIAYDVIWSAEYHAGFITDGKEATFADGAHLSMPGAAPGGVTPYAAGAFYSYYTNVKRKSVAKAAGTVDENGAPVVSSGS